MACQQLIVLVSLLWITIAAATPTNYYQDDYSASYLDPISYQFDWTVKDEPSRNDYRQEETREGQLTTGLYQVLLPDGRYQLVTYRVDNDSGFLADVTYIGEAQPYPATSNYNVQSPTPLSTYSSYPSYISYPSYPSKSEKSSYTSYPSKPAEPSYALYPSIPVGPSYASYPSKPVEPSYVSYPSKPAEPSYASYPSKSVKPSYASYPSKPAEPSYVSYPSYSSYPSYPKPSTYVEESYPLVDYTSYPQRPQVNSFMEYPPLEVVPIEKYESYPAVTARPVIVDVVDVMKPYMAPIMKSMTPKPKTVTEPPTTVTEQSVKDYAKFADYMFPIYRIDMRESKAREMSSETREATIGLGDDSKIDYIRPSSIYSAPEELGTYVVDHRKGGSRKPANSDYLVPESIRNQKE